MKLKTIVFTFIILFTMVCSSFKIVQATENDINKLEKLAGTDTIDLYYNRSDTSFFIHNKESGYIWSSCVTDELYDLNTVNELWRTNMRALFDFRYVDLTKNNATILSINYIQNRPEITTEKIKNGISIKYEFPSLLISIKVEISIHDKMLKIRIPKDSIKEEGSYGIVSIEMLPFFGASNNKEDGYIFYPDGSGALFYYKDVPLKDITKYSWYIYGSDVVDFEKYDEIREKNIKQAMLPVFGVKKGDNALVGIITEGDFDSSISFAPSGYGSIGLNRICPEFTFRRTYKDIRNNPNMPPKIQKSINYQDFEIRYYLLNGDQANYSGMANTYRKYLLEHNQLRKKSGRSTDNIPLALDVFMGIKEKRILFDRYIKVTNFDETKTIINNLLERGVDNMHVNLVGWMDKGYGKYPAKVSPSKKLGGNAGLNRLVDYTSEKGIPLYLQTNVSDALKEVGGFSVRNDVIYHNNSLIVTDKMKNRFLLNPASSIKRFSNFVEKSKKYNISGISLEKIGSLVYQDYSKKNPYSRQMTGMAWEQIMEKAANEFNICNVEGGNAYVFPYADKLTDIPVEDSKIIITDECIPFYQMVIHGIIPYTSTPGNLFYDFPIQKLKWIEYGCLPYFMLTYGQSNLLKYTDYNMLFSSYYEDWLEVAADTYSEFKDNLAGIYSELMVGHEKVMEGVYRITYESGTKIYINYNEEDIYINDKQKVKAIDYLIVGNEG